VFVLWGRIFSPKLPMEYMVTAAGQVTEEEIRLAVLRLLNPTAHSNHGTGSGPLLFRSMPTALVPNRTWPATFGLHQQPSAATGMRQLPAPRVWPGQSVNPFGDISRSTHQYLPGPALSSGIQIRKVSDLGGSIQHYFVWHGNRLMTTDGLGSHAHWRTLPMSWHKPLHFGVPPMISQAALDERSAKPVWQMTETQKLTQALWRGATRVFDNISKEDVIIAAAIIVVLSYVGISEVLALGLAVLGAVVGGLDFVLNVVQLAMDGYQRAITARSEQDLEDAADIFAKMFKDGGLDILSIVGGTQALKLLRGRGIFTVGEYFAYLKRELDIWRASRAAASRLQRPVPQNQPAPPAPQQRGQLPANATNAQKGVFGEHISDLHMQRQGHTKLNNGGQLTPANGAPQGTGLDGVWRNATPPPEYIITEAKYGTSRLGQTADGTQMSDSWVAGSRRLERAVGQREAANIRRAMANGQVQKQVHQIDANGNVTVTIMP
jgi:hypothetical protein